MNCVMSVSWESDQRIRIVIGDAHHGDRDELHQLLLAQPDIDVIGVTSDGEHALALLRRLRPNVALLDEDLPGFGGSAVARIISRELPDVQVMVLRN
jgi:DNA-binding NarL/FixJ family response regulator